MARKVVPPGTVMTLTPALMEIGTRIERGSDLRRTDFAILIKAFHEHMLGYAKRRMLDQYIACNNVAKIINESGEWFNFGTFEQSFLQVQAKPCLINVFRSGMRMPYPGCVFYHKTNLCIPPVHSFYIITDTYPAKNDPQYKDFVAGAPQFENGSFCILEYRAELLRNGQLGFMLRIGVETDYKLTFDHKGALIGYRHAVLADPLGLAAHGATSEINSCCDPVAIMLSVLNTRGVPVTRVEPPPKVNKARAKARKPLLLPYTVVDTSKYYEAAAETERMKREAKGQTRTSPRPHLRRGHIRRLHDRSVWIHDVIVMGGPDAQIARQEYKVK